MKQLSTFRVGTELFGMPVTDVQEVTSQPVLIPVPLAPPFIRGLVNLRGQIATALGLAELFSMKAPEGGERMSVVCRIDGNLVSLIVDEIGDVVELEEADFERAPETIPAEVRRYLRGVYKMQGRLLSVIDLSALAG